MTNPPNRMIRLFVLDIDGCISHPFETPDWESISEIRELNRLSREVEEIPSLSLCTGRPFPYAEAVAQWLDIRLPFVFESAVLFEPDTHRVRTLYDRQEIPVRPDPKGGEGQGDGPDSGPKAAAGPDTADREDDAAETGPNGAPDPLEQVRRFRSWLHEELLPTHPEVMPEFSKMLDAGVVSPRKDKINRIYEQIIRKTREQFPELEVHRTEVSVNTLPAGSNKSGGFDLLSRRLQIPVSQMAYIGDSEADLAPLSRVGMPFAPSNAIEPVRRQAEALPLETSLAVLRAYKTIIERNRKL